MPQVLILVTILVLAADAFPSDRSAGPGRDKRASWDDMNILAHGLLQLGQGLKEHVDKTRVQMRDVDAKLKAFNGSLAQLERARRERDGAMEARTKEQTLCFSRLWSRLRTDASTSWWRRSSSSKTSWRSRAATCRHCNSR